MLKVLKGKVNNMKNRRKNVIRVIDSEKEKEMVEI